MMVFSLTLLIAQDSLTTGYDGGFFIKGKDAKLTIEGLIQINGSFFEKNSPNDSDLFLRRMRLDITGEFFNNWLFHFEPRFLSEGVKLEEGWLGFIVNDHSFIFGRMKEPFELEETLPQRHMETVNFSILNQFAPAEDHGLTILGKFNILEYGFGLYMGTASDKIVKDKDVALRLAVNPWRKLQIGLSRTFGRANVDISGEEIKTEALVPLTSFNPGINFRGSVDRSGLELGFIEGPFGLAAEHISVHEKLNKSSVNINGSYIQTSYVLTGEDKSWKGVKPSRPFMNNPDIGTWQLVARWSQLSLDGKMSPFLQNFSDRTNSYTIGVTWYVNNFAKIKLNYLKTVFDREITLKGKNIDDDGALVLQFQMQF